jgi:hypothetical protein
LRLLSDLEAQIAYERDVPIADVPAELFCGWFDDLYHPDTDLLRSAFTARERLVLAAFHQKFEQVNDSLPEPLGRVADLHARAEWRALVRAATDTLKDLGEDAARPSAGGDQPPSQLAP